MAHKKGEGSTQNGRDSNAKRLGVKLFGGQFAKAGNIIVRQRGTRFHAGENVYMSRDFTLHAGVMGTVVFKKQRSNKTFVSIAPLQPVSETVGRIPTSRDTFVEIPAPEETIVADAAEVTNVVSEEAYGFTEELPEETSVPEMQETIDVTELVQAEVEAPMDDSRMIEASLLEAEDSEEQAMSIFEVAVDSDVETPIMEYTQPFNEAHEASTPENAVAEVPEELGISIEELPRTIDDETESAIEALEYSAPVPVLEDTVAIQDPTVEVADTEEQPTTEAQTFEKVLLPSGRTLQRDDLKLVEGIGPKIEGLFHEAGITTWEQLANTSVEKMKEILTAAGSRYQMHDPSSWANQAEMAVNGQWEQLEQYQDVLKGGKAAAADEPEEV